MLMVRSAGEIQALVMCSTRRQYRGYSRNIHGNVVNNIIGDTTHALVFDLSDHLPLVKILKDTWKSEKHLRSFHLNLLTCKLFKLE